MCHVLIYSVVRYEDGKLVYLKHTIGILRLRFERLLKALISSREINSSKYKPNKPVVQSSIFTRRSCLLSIIDSLHKDFYLIKQECLLAIFQ